MRYAMFLPGGPPEVMLDWARRIEDAGFASLWQAELVSSALVPLAAVAPAVRRITLGSGIVLAFTHSPVMLAFAALDLDLLSGGRFVLGLGVGHPNRTNNWYAGRDVGKPVAQMREVGNLLFSPRHVREVTQPVERIPRAMVDAFCAVGPVDRVRAKVNERAGLLDTVILAVPSTGTTREQQDRYRARLLEAFAS
jgi:hypothetical protein